MILCRAGTRTSCLCRGRRRRGEVLVSMSMATRVMAGFAPRSLCCTLCSAFTLWCRHLYPACRRRSRLNLALRCRRHLSPKTQGRTRCGHRRRAATASTRPTARSSGDTASRRIACNGLPQPLTAAPSVVATGQAGPATAPRPTSITSASGPQNQAKLPPAPGRRSGAPAGNLDIPHPFCAALAVRKPHQRLRCHHGRNEQKFGPK